MIYRDARESGGTNPSDSRLWNSTVSSGSPGCLTLVCVKASEAGVPPRVGVVGVERQREAATREGDESGIYGGLKLLKVFLPTQKRNKVSIGKDLGKYERRHVLQDAGTVLTSVESFEGLCWSLTFTASFSQSWLSSRSRWMSRREMVWPSGAHLLQL